jgi:hypothetical protein
VTQKQREQDREERKRREERQQKHQLHAQALSRPDDDDDGPATTRYISEEDGDAPVDGLEWMLSKTASTTNLSEERVEGDEWELEIATLLSKQAYPPSYGLYGPWRAWAHDDPAADLMPLEQLDRVQTEGFKKRGQDARHRSKDGWGVETSTRDTKESIVRDHSDDDGSSGGILGRFTS